MRELEDKFNRDLDELENVFNEVRIHISKK